MRIVSMETRHVYIFQLVDVLNVYLSGLFSKHNVHILFPDARFQNKAGNCVKFQFFGGALALMNTQKHTQLRRCTPLTLPGPPTVHVLPESLEFQAD